MIQLYPFSLSVTVFVCHIFDSYPYRFANIEFIYDIRFWRIQMSNFISDNIHTWIRIQKLEADMDMINAISDLYPIYLHLDSQFIASWR